MKLLGVADPPCSVTLTVMVPLGQTVVLGVELLPTNAGASVQRTENVEPASLLVNAIAVCPRPCMELFSVIGMFQVAKSVEYSTS